MKYMKEDCVAICKYCSHRHYGFPRNCCRCGNTKFRRAALRKGEVIVMENNHVQRRGGPVEFGSTPKLGSIDQANGASHRVPITLTHNTWFGNFRKGTCPFCFCHTLIGAGKRILRSGYKVWRLQCNGCKRTFSLKPYRRMRTPQFILEIFIELFESKKFYSSRKISDLLLIKTGHKISYVTVCRWMERHRKGKLWAKYLPNSKLNGINKPSIEYIPKITIHEQGNRWHSGTNICRRKWGRKRQEIVQ